MEYSWPIAHISYLIRQDSEVAAGYSVSEG